MRRYIEFVVRNRWLVLIAATIVTGVLVTRLGQLRVVIQPSRFLPQSHPYVVTSNRVEDLFGARSVLVIGITATHGTIYDPHILQKVATITRALHTVPNVIKTDILSFSARKAKSITGTAHGMDVVPLMVSVPTTPAGLDALRKRVDANPAYQGILVSKDARSVAIIADFKDPPQGFNSILTPVERIVSGERDSSVRISLGGLPVLLGTLERFSARLAFLMPIAMALIAIVLWFAFRSAQGLILPLLTATLAVIWSLGLMSLFGVPLDTFNATTPVLILAVGAGHAVQILKRYHEEYIRQLAGTPADPRAASRQAVVDSLVRVGPVMLIAGCVAALGFLSLLVIQIASVRSFGVMAACGILSSLALELTLIPALRSLLKPPKAFARQGDGPRPLERMMIRLAGVVSGPKSMSVMTVGLVVVALALLGATRLKYDESVKGGFFADQPVIRDDDHLDKVFAGTNTLYVLVEGRRPGRMEDPDVLRAIDGMQKYLQEQPGVGRSLSIADFIRRMNMAMHGDDPSYNTIPNSHDLIAQYLLLYTSSGDPGDFSTYVDNGYQSANIFTFLKEHDTGKFNALVGRLRAYAATHFPRDVSVSFGGSVAEDAAIHQIVARAKLLNMLQLAAVFFALTALVFRSALAGLLVLVPLAVTVAVNFGLMGWTGIPFNINNSLTAAMAVGIGADYVIYLLFRLREEQTIAPTASEAMQRTLVTAGSAIVFVAIAVAAGYSVLLLSYGYWNQIWMGILICTAMATSAAAAITLVPVLVLWLQPAFIFERKSGTRAPAAPPAVIVLVAMMLLAHAGHAAAAMQADQIMRLNFQVDRVVGSRSAASLTLIDAHGGTRVRKSTSISKLESNGVDVERFVKFTSPEDIKGTSILLIQHSAADDDMWLYLPALGKVRRLVSSNKRDSFMGSDFSYGDVMGYPVDEWHHTLLGKDSVGGEPCYLIQSLPASDEVRDTSGYSKRVSCVSKKRYVTLRMIAWDTDGEKLKEEDFSDFQEVDPARGKWVAMKSTAANFETGHKSLVVFSDYHLDANVRQDLFSVRTLEFGQ
jgi:predicted RND superfamily exporter protein